MVNLIVGILIGAIFGKLVLILWGNPFMMIEDWWTGRNKPQPTGFWCHDHTWHSETEKCPECKKLDDIFYMRS